MTAWDRLVGGIELFPGRAGRSISCKRPPQWQQLLVGRSADTLPDLLGALFTLCGHAHRHTARMAVAAARGFESLPGPNESQALRLQTARDHVRRILIDWPAALACDERSAREALSSCPAVGHGDTATALQRLAPWLAEHLLAMPCDEWMSLYHAHGPAWLAEWCSRSHTSAASALRALRPHPPGTVIAARPLRVHSDAATRQRLAQLLAEDAPGLQLDARIAPLAREHVETGAWTREATAGDMATTVANASVWMRYASRLTDLAALALLADSSSSSLCAGSFACGAGEGMAWTETGRGLLVHWVRLAGDRVARCEVVSPTDWNFHPQGPLAEAVAGLRADHSGVAKARWIAAAFDPCVPLAVQMHPESCDA